MSRESLDRYANGSLEDGHDHDLHVWVKGGLCEALGLNRERFDGLPWLEARLLAFGEAGHLERLRERNP